MTDYAGKGKVTGQSYAGSSPADFDSLKSEPNQPNTIHVSGPNPTLKTVAGSASPAGASGERTLHPDTDKGYTTPGRTEMDITGDKKGISRNPFDISHSV